jgi:integrase/recombinase XerD
MVGFSASLFQNRLLGHESPETTHQYVEADLKMKEEVLTKAEGVPVEASRYKPKPKLLEFLDSL